MMMPREIAGRRFIISLPEIVCWVEYTGVTADIPLHHPFLKSGTILVLSR